MKKLMSLLIMQPTPIDIDAIQAPSFPLRPLSGPSFLDRLEERARAENPQLAAVASDPSSSPISSATSTSRRDTENVVEVPDLPSSPYASVPTMSTADGGRSPKGKEKEVELPEPVAAAPVVPKKRRSPSPPPAPKQRKLQPTIRLQFNLTRNDPQELSVFNFRDTARDLGLLVADEDDGTANKDESDSGSDESDSGAKKVRGLWHWTFCI